MKKTVKQIENGILEAIRLRCVANGHLPDVTAYIGDNAGYQAARDLLTQAGTVIIEPFAGQDYQSNEELKRGDIIVERYDKRPSGTGTSPMLDYEKVENQPEYTKKQTAENWFDLIYKVTYICYNEGTADAIENILLEALGARRMIMSYNDDGSEHEKFWIRYRNYTDLSSKEFIERGMFYLVDDVDLIGDTDYPNVPENQEFEFEQNPQEDDIINS